MGSQEKSVLLVQAIINAIAIGLGLAETKENRGITYRLNYLNTVSTADHQ